MKNKNIIYFLFILLLFPLFSCFLTFNYSIKQQFKEADIDISKVQFYNRYKIQLKRVIKKDEISTVSGTVNFRNGKYYQVIVILNETPCVVDKVDDEKNTIYVRFEEGENKILPFKLEENIYKFGYNIFPGDDYIGKIFYDNNEYLVEVGKDSYLVIKAEDKVVERKDTIILKGKKVK
ncbi:MAG: hypothetical protein A2086_02525 [Spirochaetes bacterium GWD1_27_9]|nr:MAG: hypothetical protein A2Z98_01130 [Spirochaetes bacterium GWB1_27_13]OHD35893.1 MAG: hypothetical protein A2086_02525 [Spirochaetes bacterium GWD1_27_9]